MNEIKNEVRSADIEIKSNAVLKLTYLDMLGYDISWSAFPIIETATTSKTHLKSIGYLALSQTYTPNTDVMMLTPNLLKKDFSNDPSVALNAFTHIATPDLCIDLCPQISALMSHSKPLIRQKAISAAYVCFKVTQDLNLSDLKSRLRDRIDDDNLSVVSTAVSVIMELTTINPTECLIFAPKLYKLLTTSTNNWMLIKILKLFSNLLQYEQRLKRKLMLPISELIDNTSAVSVLYECVMTCIVGGMLSTGNIAETCIEKLTQFLQDEDYNREFLFYVLKNDYN